MNQPASVLDTSEQTILIERLPFELDDGIDSVAVGEVDGDHVVMVVQDWTESEMGRATTTR